MHARYTRLGKGSPLDIHGHSQSERNQPLFDTKPDRVFDGKQQLEIHLWRRGWRGSNAWQGKREEVGASKNKEIANITALSKHQVGPRPQQCGRSEAGRRS